MVGSTRHLYVRKLTKLLTGEVEERPPTEEEEEEEEEESSEEEQPAALVRPSPTVGKPSPTLASPTLGPSSSPVAGDATWGLRRRLLLDEGRSQVSKHPDTIGEWSNAQLMLHWSMS